MKVSMIPDNSVKMIHASQNDEGRKWEFQLYDEQGVLDVSDISDGVFEPYPVFKGGTEEILPSSLLNGVVDLGTLDWTRSLSGSVYYFASQNNQPGVATRASGTMSPLFTTEYTVEISCYC